MDGRLRQREPWQQIIATGLAFGTGLVLGNLLAQALFAVIAPSAFGRGEGLAEYNLGTSDPMATDQYRRLYEYYWDRSEIQ